MSAGTLVLLWAAARNAPLWTISSNFKGAEDLFRHAKPGSGIASFKDAGGKTVAWSTTGSPTNVVALRVLKQVGATTAKGVPTGNLVATLMQVLSGQIGIGYPLPVGVPDLEGGRTMMVGSGRDVPEFRDHTVHCLIATPGFADDRREQGVRFPQACHRTIDWIYADGRALLWFQERANATPAQSLRTRTEFYPKSAMRSGAPGNLALSMEQAIGLKRRTRPLTAEQQARPIPPIWEPPA